MRVEIDFPPLTCLHVKGKFFDNRIALSLSFQGNALFGGCIFFVLLDLDYERLDLETIIVCLLFNIELSTCIERWDHDVRVDVE